ncbi:hypothetical protein COS81_02835, partial [candidate division WWE3 bacterium CG06_land_8_20_14_3_00_42_16]
RWYWPGTVIVWIVVLVVAAGLFFGGRAVYNHFFGQPAEESVSLTAAPARAPVPAAPTAPRPAAAPLAAPTTTPIPGASLGAFQGSGATEALPDLAGQIQARKGKVEEKAAVVVPAAAEEVRTGRGFRSVVIVEKSPTQVKISIDLDPAARIVPESLKLSGYGPEGEIAPRPAKLSKGILTITGLTAGKTYQFDISGQDTEGVLYSASVVVTLPVKAEKAAAGVSVGEGVGNFLGGVGQWIL